MIPKRYIIQWQQEVPWSDEVQIEQDLIINRVLTDLYSNPVIKHALAFRGGTALNKLFIQPPARYSEDIDLVQLRSEPIGKTINTLQDILNSWLGEATVKRWQGRVTLIYRFESETEMKLPVRLKIEINTNEHFHYHPITYRKLTTRSLWFSDEIEIPTYHLNELTATKLRALYQRKKGRDLFDLELLSKQSEFNAKEVIDIFQYYLKQETSSITRAAFEKNLSEKMNSQLFLKDIDPLLARGVIWDKQKAYQIVQSKLLSLLPGNPWKKINQE